MGLKFSQTAAVPLSGTKAASQPRRRNGKLRRLRCFTAVDEGSVEVIESFGRFQRIARPGFNCVLCCFGQAVAGRLSTALQHQEVQAEVKTSDGVFVELVFSLQFRAAPDRLYSAFYSLQDPAEQVTSYMLDSLGSAISHLAVDDLFLNKAGVVGEVRRGLEEVLRAHGYAIEDCLITALAPTQSVREAMSNVKAAQRQREAAAEQGEADKLRTVKHAEASAESKYLQGQGLARFFVALAAGARESLKVLVTGRIKTEDLAFPEPPARNDTAALEAAGAVQTPMPSAGRGPGERGASAASDGRQQAGWQQGGAPTGAHQAPAAGWQQQVLRKAPGPPGSGALSKPLLGGEGGASGKATGLRAPPTPSAASGARAAAGALGL